MRNECPRLLSRLVWGFQEIFRGSEAFIRDRQRVDPPLLEARSEVVDIGCGRGEMLDLLQGFESQPLRVDNDPDNARCRRAKGHCVEQMDAVTFLRDRPAESIGAIFAAQVIEHFPFDMLKEFLALCRSRLRRGGSLVAETVNPYVLEAFKTFHTELPHQRPVFLKAARGWSPCGLPALSRPTRCFRWFGDCRCLTDDNMVRQLAGRGKSRGDA